MAAPTMLAVSDPRFPTGFATLPDIFASTWVPGNNAFLFFDRDNGWSIIPSAFKRIVVLTAHGVVSTSGGAILSWTPPEGQFALIGLVQLYVAAKSSGAATVDVGTAANATTASDNLIDGCDVGTNSTVVFDNITDVGTNGKSRQVCLIAQPITVTGLADTTGLIFSLVVEYLIP